MGIIGRWSDNLQDYVDEVLASKYKYDFDKHEKDKKKRIIIFKKAVKDKKFREEFDVRFWDEIEKKPGINDFKNHLKFGLLI